MTPEEFKPIREKAVEKVLVRNFATTSSLLNSDWAQTPYELVAQIRYQASTFFEPGLTFKLTDDNGTHLEGIIDPPNHPAFPSYTTWRKEGLGYRPFPEWVFPPINISSTSGVFVFDRTLSWWSRFAGILPVFNNPIRLIIEKNRIIRIEGEGEAESLRRFLAFMENKIDDSVYNFPEIHSGVHPQAWIGPHQCASPLYRRLIDHANACNIHAHIGAPPQSPRYPYWMHLTADIRTATWKIGNKLLHDRGHMTVLDHPDVLATAEKYPQRPGLEPGPVIC